jgi:hypothetical protein
MMSSGSGILLNAECMVVMRQRLSLHEGLGPTMPLPLHVIKPASVICKHCVEDM